MKKYHGNTVKYWKRNAEENYLTTPISVLKYITVLEEQAEQLRKINASHRTSLNNTQNKDLSRNDSNTMLGDSTFNVSTITYQTETNNGYCHWSDGLKMYIEKDGKTIILNSDEIQELVKTLPRTLGGSY